MTMHAARATAASLRDIIDIYNTTGARTAVLVTGPAGSGKTTLVERALSAAGLPVQRLHDGLLTQPETAIAAALHSAQAVFLDNLDLYAPAAPSPLENRLIAALVYALRYARALFLATAGGAGALHPDVWQRITHVIELDALTYGERLRAAGVLGDCRAAVAEATPGFLWSDFRALHARLLRVPPSQRVDALPAVLERVRPALLGGHARGAAPTLHGLQRQTEALSRVLESVFCDGANTPARRALRSIGVVRGVLIHGDTGCGKTALARFAKGVLKASTVNFLEVLSTTLVGSVVGEGERELKRLFGIARAIAPCVVVIDNIDVIAPRRGGEGPAVRAFERVLSTLLVLIDGVVRDDRRVLVIGTTRDLRLVDGALLRPGRFDVHIRVEPPDADARVRIMEEFLSCRGMTPADVGIGADFGEASEGWTAPHVLGYVRKKVLQNKANFI